MKKDQSNFLFKATVGVSVIIAGVLLLVLAVNHDTLLSTIQKDKSEQVDSTIVTTGQAGLQLDNDSQEIGGLNEPGASAEGESALETQAEAGIDVSTGSDIEIEQDEDLQQELDLEEESENSEEESVLPESLDGRHTLVNFADGRQEWVLISDKIEKNTVQTTYLNNPNNRMEYVVDGAKKSFLGTYVSKDNAYIDFLDMKKDGIDFVMVQIGSRGYESGQITLDSYYVTYLEGAQRAEVAAGVIFTSHAITTEEAVEEAEVILREIASYDIAYPVVFRLDAAGGETTRDQDLSKSERSKIAEAFLETIEEAGYIGMIYGDKEWLMTKVNMAWLMDYDVWISQTDTVLDYPYRTHMWEYSNKGSVDGMAGDVSLVISFVDYLLR